MNIYTYRNPNAGYLEKIWEQYQKDKSLQNRDRLVEYYFPSYVETIVNRKFKYIKYNGFTKDDLVSWGADGLIQAIEIYEDIGFKFESYAQPIVHRRIVDALRLWKDLRKTTHINFTSLNKIISDESYHSLEVISTIRNYKAVDPYTEYQNRNISELFMFLPTDQRIAMVLYIKGLYRCSERAKSSYRATFTMKEIGKCLGITESRISQLLSQARKRIKSYYTKQELKELLSS